MSETEYEKELLSLLREHPDREEAISVALGVIISLAAPHESSLSPAVFCPPGETGTN